MKKKMRKDSQNGDFVGSHAQQKYDHSPVFDLILLKLNNYEGIDVHSGNDLPMMFGYQGVHYMTAYAQEEVEVVDSLNLYSPDFQGNHWAQPIEEMFIIMSTNG